VTTPARTPLPHLGRFALHVGRRFADDHCFSLAASLAYTTLLSLVPLVTIALTVIAAFPVFREFTEGLDDFFAANMLPPDAAKAITAHIEEFTHSASRLTAVGVIFLAVTAIMLMLTIERACDAIWRVERPRPLVFRVLMYWGVLTLGPLLIGVSLTVTSYLVGMSLGLVREMPGAAGALLGLVPIGLTAVAFTLMYYVVPNRPVELKHAIVGGIAAAVMFEAMKRGFALYLGRFPSYTLVYGAFAALPIFLVWIYFSWVVVLLGAVITALLPDLRVLREAREARAGSSLRHALEILRVLIAAQRESRTPRTREVLAEARAPRELGERALEEMAAAGWTARLVGDRWALACDPNLVTIADVYKRLVLEPIEGRGRPGGAVIDGVIERAAGGIDRAISAPISSLVAAEDEGEAARDAPQGARTADRRGRAGPSASLRR